MARKYKCIFCSKSFERDKLSTHIDKEHEEMLNENKGYTSNRIVFDICNKKEPVGAGHGSCRICKKDTNWNEQLIRYEAYCSPNCKSEARRRAKENMVKVYGKETLLDDIDWQNDKMLANRKISGKYKWSDGTYKTYVGSYEQKFLEFCDVVLQIRSEDLLTPGPRIEYEFEGKKHAWITDAIYLPYNLVFDIKDGGNNKNNREMPEYRSKQLAKEACISKDGQYSYIRLTNNEFDQLLSIFAELKMSYQENVNPKTITRIHEHMGLAAANPMVGPSQPQLFITNYMKKNSFEKGWFVSNDIVPDKVLTVKKKKLKKEDGDNLINNSECVVYRYKGDVNNVLRELFYNYKNDIDVDDDYLPKLLTEFDNILNDEQLDFSTMVEQVDIESMLEQHNTNIETLKFQLECVKHKVNVFPVLDPIKYEYKKALLREYEDVTILQDMKGKYFALNRLNQRRTRGVDSIYEINKSLLNTIK